MIFLKKIKCNLIVFSIGALGYGLIEILWRGRTHWSMLTAGGISFWGLCRISTNLKRLPLVKKAFLGCGLITVIEYIYGIVFNKILGKNVWNYSKMPLNLSGQICALYSFFWFILSLLFIPLANKLHNILED